VLTAWRIVKAKRLSNAFDGEGARLFGGRWNSPGVPMVYLAGSRALAALEMAVHLDRSTLLASFALIECSFDESLVAGLASSALPSDWKTSPPPLALATLGDTWVKEAKTAILAVPSAVIEEELNFLLNPGHPDFAKVKISTPRRFDFDPRLLK